MKTKLVFDIEILKSGPEFGVWNPTFQTLKLKKNIKVTIHVEFEDGKLISQSAFSKWFKEDK